MREFLHKGVYMLGAIRKEALKHRIAVIVLIVFALTASSFSQRAFAEEPLPAAPVEDGGAYTEAEGIAPEAAETAPKAEEAAPEAAETAPKAEEAAPDKAAACSAADGAAAAEEAAVRENAAAAEAPAAVSGNAAAAETPAAVSGNAAAAEAPAAVSGNAVAVETPAAVSENAAAAEAPAAVSENAAAAETPAMTESEEKTGGSEEKTGESEEAAGDDAAQPDETDQEATDSIYDETADAAQPDAADQAAAADDAAQPDMADQAAAGGEDTDAGTARESDMVKAGETTDPLLYLMECLKYHGDEKNPPAYSLRAYTKDGQSIVTPVKDQEPWNACWSFSVIAASESSILSECHAKWDQLAPGLSEKFGIKSFQELCAWLDLSERQLAWFTYMPEPENGNYPSQAGEGFVTTDKTIGGIYNAGGINTLATPILARGTGPLEESRLPYRNNENVLVEKKLIKAKDGTEYRTYKYAGYMTETRNYEYEYAIPPGMTKEDILAVYKNVPDTREKYRQRLEEGVITRVDTASKYVDDKGKYYHVVRFNELLNIDNAYPEILIYEDENGVRYTYDPVTKTYPGLPALHEAVYDWSVDESLRYASLLSLEKTNILPAYIKQKKVNEDAIKAIKEELLAGRGVSFAYAADGGPVEGEDALVYLNVFDNAWAQYGAFGASNHEATIIGYNDNFPKTFFIKGQEPPEDGAWLVKNSWGGGLSSGPDFGNFGIDENGDGIGDGYFWLSYYDASISFTESFDYRVEDLATDRMEYDIRQHDLMTHYAPYKYDSEKEANVFTADVTTNVREIGVQNAEGDTTISYEIYLLNKDAADPTDGALIASGSEFFKYAGYHRIKTDKACIIPAGLKYSVVVTMMKADKPYVSVFFGDNEQSVKDQIALGNDLAKTYANAVVNRGESYILDKGKWTDWVDAIPAFKRFIVSTDDTQEEKWTAVDNFSIKAYADYIAQELRAEATKIGSTAETAATGVADKDAAEKDALVPLARIYNEISNNTTAENAASYEKGYISADDYNQVVQTLIDPNRETGLKVVVTTAEVPASEIAKKELDLFLDAAGDKIARYADISLIVKALDSGEYLGKLLRTDNPIDLAIAIPAELIASGNPFYVLRLHDGVVKKLATTVKDGIAYFASDLFSRFALAYDESKPETAPEEKTPDPVSADEPEPAADEPEPAADEEETHSTSEDPASKEEEPVQTGTAKTAEIKAAAVRITPAKTADANHLNLWLLMALLADAMFAAAFPKKAGRMKN